jgi:hypothetical protein
MIKSSTKPRQPRRRAWPLDRLIHERSIALGSSLDKSTFGSYSSALNSYITFCKLHKRPIEPTADTMSFYVVYMSHHIKPDSVDTYLSGICNQLELHFPNVRSIRSSHMVSRTLRGCKRLYGSEVRRKLPIGIDDLRRIISSIGHSTSHDDKLFLCQLLTGFHGLLRCGELTSHDSPSRRNSRKATMRFSVVHPSPSSFGFTLPSNKTDPFFQGNHIVIKWFIRDVDPLPFFSSYVSSRDRLFPIHPQLWLRENGSVPTRSWFINRLRKFFPDGQVAGQSMRAGGATCLASCGATPAIIQAAGRWVSNTFQIYIRKNPILLQALLHSDCEQL